MIFQQKCSSCYILLTDQILLPDCFYFLRYWAICVLQLFVNQVVTSKKIKINLILLIKPFLYMHKKSRQNLKYLENEKSLVKGEKKTFFIIFKGLSVVKNFSRPYSAPLIRALISFSSKTFSQSNSLEALSIAQYKHIFSSKQKDYRNESIRFPY